MQRREIQAAVQTDDVELFRFLLQKEGLSPNYDTSRDFSPLFQACIWNSPNIVFELLHSEERWFDPEHPNSIAAFRMACYYGYEQIVDTFVDALESWCPAPEYKEGPYETARMMGRTAILLTMDSRRTIMRSLLDLREIREASMRERKEQEQIVHKPDVYVFNPKKGPQCQKTKYEGSYCCTPHAMKETTTISSDKAPDSMIKAIDFAMEHDAPVILSKLFVKGTLSGILQANNTSSKELVQRIAVWLNEKLEEVEGKVDSDYYPVAGFFIEELIRSGTSLRMLADFSLSRLAMHLLNFYLYLVRPEQIPEETWSELTYVAIRVKAYPMLERILELCPEK